jgi:hypothetical protein
VPVTLGLALGSIGGGVVTWRFGRSIGLDHFRYLVQHAPVGMNFGKPVDLRAAKIGLWHGVLPYARGDVLALALAAIVIYLLLAGFSPHPSLRAPAAGEEPDGEPEPDEDAPVTAGHTGPAEFADRPAAAEHQVSSGS